jgi:hypothetical protein
MTPTASAARFTDRLPYFQPIGRSAASCADRSVGNLHVVGGALS